MKAKMQKIKDKQLKGFTQELAELSRKYGIIISVEPKKVKYSKVEEIEYKIGDDYGCSKIYATNILYSPIQFDSEKRFNIEPQTELGFYRTCVNFLKDESEAFEYWKLIHSIITQISKESPEIIGHYLDTVNVCELLQLLKRNKSELIVDIPRLYTNYIDRNLTNFIKNYENYADMKGWN